MPLQYEKKGRGKTSPRPGGVLPYAVSGLVAPFAAVRRPARSADQHFVAQAALHRVVAVSAQQISARVSARRGSAPVRLRACGGVDHVVAAQPVMMERSPGRVVVHEDLPWQPVDHEAPVHDGQRIASAPAVGRSITIVSVRARPPTPGAPGEFDVHAATSVPSCRARTRLSRSRGRPG